MVVVTSALAFTSPAETSCVATVAGAVAAGGFVASVSACLSEIGCVGFGPGAGLKKYCEANSTSIISASASGRRFSRLGGSELPGLFGIKIQLSYGSANAPDRTHLREMDG